MAQTTTDSPGWVNTVKNIIELATHHIKITAVLIGIIAIFYGWRELQQAQRAKGRALRPLGAIIKATVLFAIKEDNTPLISKPEKLADKTTWLTGKRLYLIGLPLSIAAAWAHVPFATIIAITIALILITRARKFQAMRHSIIMQMFNVANGECRYGKGQELNPWAVINVQSWQSPTTPGTTIVTYPAAYQSEEMKTREKFERQFNGTVSDQNSWTYQWESSKNRVICKPSSFLPTMANYPGPGEDWDKIPIGISADGGYSQWDVKTFPHALVCGPTGTGKAYSTRQAVPTPTGWTTIGEIKIGDYVLDEQGLPVKVLGYSPTTYSAEAYEIEFSDGTIHTVSGDHLWWTETRGARESRWTEAKRPPSRKPLLTAEQIAALETELAKADPDSEITIRDAAAIAGVSDTTPWIRELAAHSGQVGEIQFDVLQNYSAQVVKSMQWVRRWAALEAWSVLAVKKCRNTNWKYEYLRPRFAELAAATAPGLMLSATEIGELLDIPRAKAVDLMKQSGALCVKNRELLEQHVPESTVVKKSGWTATYPMAAFLSLMIEHGRRTPYDQRHKRVLGGTRTTKEILETLRTPGGQANHSIPVAKPLVLPEADLPIEPYTLGAWLGDGSSRTAEVCGIDHEVARWIEKDGYETTERQVGTAQHPNFRIWTIHGIRKHLGTLGVLKRHTSEGLTKFIPIEYLRASIEQRRDLLAGLLDTDGTVDPQGTVSITQVNPRLARDIFELVNSLGFKGSIREGRATLNGVDHGPTWTVEFAAEVSPFNLSRKTDVFAARSRWSAERNSRRWIVDVRPVESVPMRCIRVDNESHLFLVGDSFIATHNSVLQRNIIFHCLAHSDRWRIVGIDPKRVEMQWIRDYPSVLRVATELPDALDVLRMLKNEMHRRYQDMEAEGVNLYLNLAEAPPSILLMIDETTILLAPEKIKSDEGKERDEMHAEAGMIIGELGRLARAAGIHVIACMQRPDAEFLKGETKANFDCRIVAGRTDTTPSMMILDSEAATRLPLIKGRGMIRLGGQMQTFQGFYAEGDWYDNYVAEQEAKAAGVAVAEEAGQEGRSRRGRKPKEPKAEKEPAVEEEPKPEKGPRPEREPKGALGRRVAALKAKAATPPEGVNRVGGAEAAGGAEVAGGVSVDEAQRAAEASLTEVDFHAPVFDVEPESESFVEPEPELEPVVEPEPVPVVEPEPVRAPEPAVTQEATPAPVVHPGPVSAPGQAPEPAPVAPAAPVATQGAEVAPGGRVAPLPTRPGLLPTAPPVLPTAPPQVAAAPRVAPGVQVPAQGSVAVPGGIPVTPAAPAAPVAPAVAPAAPVERVPVVEEADWWAAPSTDVDAQKPEPDVPSGGLPSLFD